MPPKKPPPGPYRHLIGGEYKERRHEPGDRVDGRIPDSKVAEWLAAGIIEPEPKEAANDSQERKRKPPRENS